MSVDDFGDGGAFPEIHVVQYPLHMGRPGHKSSAVVAVAVDEAGGVRFDAIVKQGPCWMLTDRATAVDDPRRPTLTLCPPSPTRWLSQARTGTDWCRRRWATSRAVPGTR